MLLIYRLHFAQNLYKLNIIQKMHRRPQTTAERQVTTIIHYSLFIIHYSSHHRSPQKHFHAKNRAGSHPLCLSILLLLYPLTAQDLRKQRPDRQYSYKLCRMCSYRPQRNIRYPDRRTGADHRLLCSMSCPRPQTSKDLSGRHL